MADYLPLISRAVSNLPEDTPDARRAIYERARAALEQQLRSLNPPLPEADIIRERVALDEAIAQVENERLVAPLIEPGLPEPGDFRDLEAQPTAPAEPMGAPSGSPPRLRQIDGGAEAANIPDALRGAPTRTPLRPPSRTNGTPPDAGPGAMPDDDMGADGDLSVADDAGRPMRPRIETAAPRRRNGSHRWRTIIVAAVIGLVIAGIAAIAVMNKDNQPVPAPRTAQPEQPAAGDRKFAERVGGEAQPAAPAPIPAPSAAGGGGEAASPAPSPADGQPALPVAQRAILYEESPDNPRVPVVFNGRAVWRLDSVNVGQGQPAETAIRADIDVASAGLTLTMIIRRNTDPTLPASHLVQLTFAVSGAATEARSVRDIGVPQMKIDENARGTPLAGLPVPVTPNVFLIGLSSIRGDTERNVEALKTSPWMDLPVRFANGRRGIIAIERGVSGERTIAEAFAAWGQ